MCIDVPHRPGISLYYGILSGLQPETDTDSLFPGVSPTENNVPVSEIRVQNGQVRYIRSDLLPQYLSRNDGAEDDASDPQMNVMCFRQMKNMLTMPLTRRAIPMMPSGNGSAGTQPGTRSSAVLTAEPQN